MPCFRHRTCDLRVSFLLFRRSPTATYSGRPLLPLVCGRRRFSKAARHERVDGDRTHKSASIDPESDRQAGIARARQDGSVDVEIQAVLRVLGRVAGREAGSLLDTSVLQRQCAVIRVGSRVRLSPGKAEVASRWLSKGDAQEPEGSGISIPLEACRRRSCSYFRPRGRSRRPSQTDLGRRRRVRA